MVASPHFIERALAGTATVTDIDFSKYDLDQPLRRLTTNGEQGSLDKFAQWGIGTTFRQRAMARFGTPGSEMDFRWLARHTVVGRLRDAWRRSCGGSPKASLLTEY